ncbi:djbp [Sucra jujuba nucleopolyhedrovirus]|uniref:Djbp n=1 Tax=Sucra jujuba nucleopolyhedrovirus TaxID=1563660 RepID=A0A097P8Z8_9ABAC|nr:djbp [Sucra jujuba nucleopolyhedrovirus]AIU41274.1 djbp [Sucra jujuba nucleopolyhedrovirus]
MSTRSQTRSAARSIRPRPIPQPSNTDESKKTTKSVVNPNARSTKLYGRKRITVTPVARPPLPQTVSMEQENEISSTTEPTVPVEMDVAQPEDTLISSLESKIETPKIIRKRPSESYINEDNMLLLKDEADDNDDVTSTPNKPVSTLKKTKFDYDYLLYINLFSNDFYTLFNLKQSDSGYMNRLILHYDQIKKMLNVWPDSMFEHNDRKTIESVIDYGYSVLQNRQSKLKYNTYLTHKYSDLYVDVVNVSQAIGKKIKGADDTFKQLVDMYEQFLTGEYLENAVNYGLSKLTNIVPAKRPSSLNRILISWEDDKLRTIESLENYFSKYGTINGTILCQKKSKCAMMEFTTASSVVEALKDTYYKVTEVKKWTLNFEYKQKVITLHNIVSNIEHKYNEYLARQTAHDKLLQESI